MFGLTPASNKYFQCFVVWSVWGHFMYTAHIDLQFNVYIKLLWCLLQYLIQIAAPRYNVQYNVQCPLEQC
jgi:hypothetical protein